MRLISMESNAISERTVAPAAGEGECITRCKNGDQAAFGFLVSAYQDRIFNLCYRMCGDRGEAEDLTQEAFMKALRAIGAFDGRAGFYTWIYRIAVNLALSQRRKFPRRVVSLDAPDRDGHTRAEGLASAHEPTGRGMEDREQGALIEAALKKLEDEHRAVIILRDMESLDYNQIAEVLGVPAGTVKSRLHRARCALRDILGPMLGIAK